MDQDQTSQPPYTIPFTVTANYVPPPAGPTICTTQGNIISMTDNACAPPNFSINSGSAMTASFVNDKFVEVKLDGRDQPLYQRMADKEMSGASLHPLLKTVIKEANSLEQEKKDLLKTIEGLKSELDTVRSQLSSSMNQDRINDLEYQKGRLEKCLVNQEASLDALQTMFDELVEAHASLQRKHLDYSEESVNQIVEDYQTQLAHYESIIREYEKNPANGNSDVYSLAELEIKNARADFAHRISPYVSMKWIRKNIFKLSDDEIKEIEAQVAQESPVFTQEQVDRIVEQAKLELIAKQDSAISHEDKIINIGPGAKVWQTSTGKGPFWTQTLKTFRHNDKEKSTSPGWLVHNARGKPEHYPVGDLTDKEPASKGPNKLAHMMIYTVNAVAMQLVAAQAFGLKAIIPMTIAQTLVAAFTYRDVFKATK